MIAEKGSGDLTIELPCDKIATFCQALIAGDKLKGVLRTCGITYISYCTEFPCDETARFCQALIAGDGPKRGATWDYVAYYTSGMYYSLCNPISP